MIPATKLVYDFERKYNQSGRGDRKQLNLVDIISYLNEAQGIWYEQMAHIYETNNYVASELRPFQENSKKLIQNGDDNVSVIFSLPSDLYKRLNQRVTVKQAKCCPEIVKTFPMRIDTTDKINEVLNNPLQYPSFAWERISGNEAGRSLHVYNGDMVVDEVRIDYLRFPQEIHAPSLINGNTLMDNSCTDRQYTDYAGALITKDQNFEPTARFSDRKVVDIAVMVAHGDRQDYQAFQKQLQLIMFGDNSLKN
jgi:hypothetical protein